MGTRMPRIFKMKEDSRMSLLLVFFFIVLAISPTPKQGQNRPGQRGVVESWAPQTRRMTTTSGQREFLQQRQPSAGLTMVPVRVQDETGSLPSAAPVETLPEQEPLESRITAILEFVDSILFDSRLSGEDAESILTRVHGQHRNDFDTAKASYLEVEERDTENPPSPFSFERIGLLTDVAVTANPTLAIRSTEPILDASSVDAVKEAAEDVWKAEREGSDSGKSRFTYQYSGNSEAHVFDFITTTTTNTNTNDSAGKRAISALNEALQRKIYPTIREAFFQINGTKSNQGDDDGTLLFVYDALVIRYNSTKAAEAAKASGEILASAGQPLHRDLGLVSVNIMLNSAENFEGGGTFFENQLLGVDSGRIQPLKPSGVGYCLAHSASERHAGAGTTTGVRDILVLFVSAATRAGVSSSSSSKAIEAPAELLSARLKNCRTFCEGQPWNAAPMESEEQWMEAQRSTLLCRILHQRLAVTAGPKGGVAGSLLSRDDQTYCDGEALQYLGTALMEYSGLVSDPSEAIRVLEVASECFTVASSVTPCDSRVYNNLGIVLGRIHEMEQSHDDGGGVAQATQRLVEQETAYRKGLDILQRSIQAGCTNESLLRDLDSLSLNYGLFLANQDRFHDAAEVLEPVAAASRRSSDAATGTGHDAVRLWKYCRDRCLEEPTSQ